MTLDHYQPCLCGSGKKIKFCCCHDIASDLEKIVRMLQGDQRAAALEQLNHLIEAKGPRAALLSIKVQVALSLRDATGATAAAAALLKLSPGSQVPLAMCSLAATLRGDIVEAIEKLHRAIDAAAGQPGPELRMANLGVARALLDRNDVIGGRAYLQRQIEFELSAPQGENERDEQAADAFQALRQIALSPEVPPQYKLTWNLVDCPATVVWREEFEKAKEIGQTNWWRGCELFDALASRYSNQPSILWNLAVLRSRIGNVKLTVSSLRAYANAPGVPLDDAVEAESVAQMLDPASQKDSYPLVGTIYPILDSDRFMERMLSDKRVSRVQFDRRTWDPESGPAPKALFTLLDRPLPATGVNMTRAEVPNGIGTLLVFGRETDKPARADLQLVKSPDYDSKLALWRDVAGDLIGDAIGESSDESIPMMSHHLSWRWHFPSDTSEEQRAKLSEEQHHEVVLNKWPTLPLSQFDGKRPIDVAGEPAWRIRLLGSILNLELVTEDHGFNFNFDDLRRKLNLPTNEPIDASSPTFDEQHLFRLHRVLLETCRDSQVATIFHLANGNRLRRATLKFGDELMKRSGTAITVEDKLAVHMSRAAYARSRTEVTSHFRAARAEAEAANMSPAPFLFYELENALQTGDAETATQIIQRLQQRHINEPGVRQRLYSLMVQLGIITPDGRPTMRPDQGLRPAGAAPAAAAAPAPGKLWTPGSGAPTPNAPPAPGAGGPPAGGEQKSRLILPGMD